MDTPTIWWSKFSSGWKGETRFLRTDSSGSCSCLDTPPLANNNTTLHNMYRGANLSMDWWLDMLQLASISSYLMIFLCDLNVKDVPEHATVDLRSDYDCNEWYVWGCTYLIPDASVWLWSHLHDCSCKPVIVARRSSHSCTFLWRWLYCAGKR